jgi:hypothetical protein
VVVNAQAKAGAIFIEASFLPNMIDDNFVWGTRAAGNGLMRMLGLKGHGLYEHDCSHHFFGHFREGPMTVAGPFNQVPAQATKVKLWDGMFHDPASPRTNNPD